jgi:hypothetical protein
VSESAALRELLDVLERATIAGVDLESELRAYVVARASVVRALEERSRGTANTEE